jgi:tryptophan synthase beta chain
VAKELGPDALIVVNLSGRGDKDMHTAADYFEVADAGPQLDEDEAHAVAEQRAGDLHTPENHP